MIKYTELVAILVSICSVVSSALYTYMYVRGQTVSFFNEIHSDFASYDMLDAFKILESFRAATGHEHYAEEYMRSKMLWLGELRYRDTASGAGKVGFGLCGVCPSEAELG